MRVTDDFCDATPQLRGEDVSAITSHRERDHAQLRSAREGAELGLAGRHPGGRRRLQVTYNLLGWMTGVGQMYARDVGFHRGCARG